MTPPPLPDQRHLFDLPPDVTYLNTATFGPFLREMRTAGMHGIERRLRPWSIDRESFYAEVEEVRGLFARILGAATDDIALVPSASYGVAVAAANLPVTRGRAIVVPEFEHGSNFYAWQSAAERHGGRMHVAPRPTDGDWTAAILACIDDSTAVVAVPQCHWSDGAAFDLAAIGASARSVGAALVVDATQSIGAAVFDLAAIRPDFLVCSGYKWLLCPYGLSFLYAAPHRQNGLGIELHGFNRAGARAVLGATFEHLRAFEPGARRYDMGERSNFIALPMARIALARLLDWGVAAIAATLALRTRRVAQDAAAIGLGAPPEARRLGHIVGLAHPTGWSADIEARLRSEGIHAGLRGDRLRISPHLYTDDSDLARLAAALSRHARRQE